MVQLVDYQVGSRLGGHPVVVFPSHGVGFVHVDNGTSHAVHTHGACIYARSLFVVALRSPHVEGVELVFQVAFHLGFPAIVLHRLHAYGFERLASYALMIESQDGRMLLVLRREEQKRGARG